MYKRMFECWWIGESSMREMGSTKTVVKAPKYDLSDEKRCLLKDNQKVGLKAAIL